MSAWTLWTWVSIAVLVAGSTVVFLLFVRDARRLFNGMATRDRRDAKDADEAANRSPRDER